MPQATNRVFISIGVSKPGGGLDELPGAIKAAERIADWAARIRIADGLYNSASVFTAGAFRAVYRKQRLPNYAVFDEKRYFVAGNSALTFELNEFEIGLSICEDIWDPATAVASRRRFHPESQCLAL